MNEENEKIRRHRPRYNRSLFFPLLLVALGVVFLLENLNALTGDAWDTIWKLWPLILVVMGLDGLLRGDGVAGPVFFAGLGVVFLLSNFGLLAWNVWDLILRLWPVMLIAWGLDLVVGRRSLWGAALALVLVLAILAGALLLVGVGAATRAEAVSWTPESTVTQVRASLEPAVGSLRVDASSEGAIVQGMLHLWQGESVRKETRVDGGIGVFGLSTKGVSVYYPTIPGSGPVWELSFSPVVPLDLQIKMGAGDVVLDLRELNLSNLQMELGVGRTQVYLPAKTFSAKLEGAVGQTVIVLPKGAAVRIKTDTGITSVSVPSDFHRSGDEYSLSGGSGASSIDLDVSQAIGSLVIRFDQ